MLELLLAQYIALGQNMFSFINSAELFSLILTLATVITGGIFFLDKYRWQPQREKETGVTDKEQTGWVAQARSMFPVLFAILIIRSFIIEPFQIPSGSMQPTLLPGDFIGVEKFAYGLHDPVFHKTLIPTGKPQRGDITVFIDPENPKIDLIKRIVGLPGDTVIYRDKTLYIKPACNGQKVCPSAYEVPKQFVGVTKFTELGTDLDEYKEHLGNVEHHILRDPNLPEMYSRYYQQPGSPVGEWVVPKGHYFAMGDNRDNSLDSRYWGFMPEQNLVGKATFIWISFTFNHNPDSSWPSWLPNGVRFNRIGAIH